MIDIINILITAIVTVIFTEALDITVRLAIGGLTVVAAIWGAKAGVKLATSKEVVVERVKVETKERMKIEDAKEIIQAIKNFYPYMNQLNKEIITAAEILQITLEKIKETGIDPNDKVYLMYIKLINTPKEMELENIKENVDIAANSIEIKKWLIEKEKIIFLLENDLKINGHDALIKKEIENMEKMFNEMESIFRIKREDCALEKAMPHVNEIIGKCKKYDTEEAKYIFDNLTDLYIKRLN